MRGNEKFKLLFCYNYQVSTYIICFTNYKCVILPLYYNMYL